jgi:hypothetical protein
MAQPNEDEWEQEQLSRRAATLRSLRYVHSQMTALTEHIVALQQQIRRLEQRGELPQEGRRRAG